MCGSCLPPNVRRRCSQRKGRLSSACRATALTDVRPRSATSCIHGATKSLNPVSCNYVTAMCWCPPLIMFTNALDDHTEFLTALQRLVTPASLRGATSLRAPRPLHDQHDHEHLQSRAADDAAVCGRPSGCGHCWQLGVLNRGLVAYPVASPHTTKARDQLVSWSRAFPVGGG